MRKIHTRISIHKTFLIVIPYCENLNLFSPRVMDVPGGDLQNVCYLRCPNDGNAIGWCNCDPDWNVWSDWKVCIAHGPRSRLRNFGLSARNFEKTRM
jgi:hypothetical protein